MSKFRLRQISSQKLIWMCFKEAGGRRRRISEVKEKQAFSSLLLPCRRRTPRSRCDCRAMRVSNSRNTDRRPTGILCDSCRDSDQRGRWPRRRGLRRWSRSQPVEPLNSLSCLAFVLDAEGRRSGMFAARVDLMREQFKARAPVH